MCGLQVPNGQTLTVLPFPFSLILEGELNQTESPLLDSYTVFVDVYE